MSRSETQINTVLPELVSNYTQSGLKDLVHAEIETRIKLRELITDVLRVQQFVKDQTATSYFQYGVTRRLYVLVRTFDRIFELYPPDRSVPLLYDDRIDLEINLHAFMIHVHGVVDNLALVVGHELNMVGQGSHQFSNPEVGFFKSGFVKKLPNRLSTFLQQETLVTWHKDYAKEYHDSLAHRIPAYVPPRALDTKETTKYAAIDQRIRKSIEGGRPVSDETWESLQSVGRVNPLFLLSPDDQQQPMYLHPQVIADIATVDEITRAVINCIRPDRPDE